MAIDENLSQRVRVLLSDHAPTEKSMFGGLAFIVNGHMTVAVGDDGLLVRVDPDAEWLSSDPRAGDAMPGRPMRNWRSFDVDSETEDLPALVEHALEQVRALPNK
ncbi:TfoX/Sxy family protein [Gordonia sp. HY002]|uniref:TfoX/Sxy family protein n=1 Tax=Gordonia zhenghanii TaxID=2911516 RepID=UPI001EF0F4BE|nr:TfoX/Sxy family protein [Gordonia zhenghanii]MCF8569952.1 TfoX/Sxy family protein [Gordonia zhenghanii]MCF8605091.1 TfoX/Sxy family protein [Gordonia zhenghanii]